jgi:hypothetical protein
MDMRGTSSAKYDANIKGELKDKKNAVQIYVHFLNNDM